MAGGRLAKKQKLLWDIKCIAAVLESVPSSYCTNIKCPTGMFKGECYVKCMGDNTFTLVSTFVKLILEKCTVLVLEGVHSEQHRSDMRKDQWKYWCSEKEKPEREEERSPCTDNTCILSYIMWISKDSMRKNVQTLQTRSVEIDTL